MLLDPLSAKVVGGFRTGTCKTDVEILVNTPVRNHGGMTDGWTTRETVVGRMRKPASDGSQLLSSPVGLQEQVDWEVLLSPDVVVSTAHRLRAKGILMKVHSTDRGRDDALVQVVSCMLLGPGD